MASRLLARASGFCWVLFILVLCLWRHSESVWEDVFFTDAHRRLWRMTCTREYLVFERVGGWPNDQRLAHASKAHGSANDHWFFVPTVAYDQMRTRRQGWGPVRLENGPCFVKTSGGKAFWSPDPYAQVPKDMNDYGPVPFASVSIDLPESLPFLLIVPAASAVAKLVRRRVRALRRRDGLCLACGYNLVAATGGVCPECGARVKRAGEEKMTVLRRVGLGLDVIGGITIIVMGLIVVWFWLMMLSLRGFGVD